MKRTIMLVLTSFFALNSNMHACPTCASSLDDYSPPFFSEEFYAPRKEKSEKAAPKQELIIDEGENDEEPTDLFSSSTAIQQ